MSEYETDEALEHMKRLAGDRDHAGQKAAAQKLEAAVRRVIEAGGGNFGAEVRPGTGGKVYISRGNTIVANLLCHESGVRFWDQEKGAADGRWLPIEYDAVAGRFVGTEEDTSRHPVPGELRQRRNAVTVIVDEIAKVYREMFPARDG